MIYELMTGKVPFTATSSTELLNKHLKARPPELSMLQPNVRPEFGKLVHRMLAKEPDDRPESLMEFYREMKAGRCFHIKPRPPLTEEEEAAKKAEEDGLDS